MATRLALIWEQFAPYHIDRIEAVGRRLAGRVEVVAVEVATTSHTYDWKPSAGTRHARKLTLFPGQSYDVVHPMRRLWRQWFAVAASKHVFIGIGYDRPDIIALSWLLRLGQGLKSPDRAHALACAPAGQAAPTPRPACQVLRPAQCR